MFNDAIVMISQKNRKVLYALDTIRRRLLFEGADMNTFFCLEKEMQESMQRNIKQTTLEQYFTSLNNKCFLRVFCLCILLILDKRIIRLIA